VGWKSFRAEPLSEWAHKFKNGSQPSLPVKGKVTHNIS